MSHNPTYRRRCDRYAAAILAALGDEA